MTITESPDTVLQQGSARASILLAHGSSDPHWLAPFDVLLSQIREAMGANGCRTELAYMELAEPSLSAQVNTLAAEGISSIDILPLFFAAGRHLRRDVPVMIDALQQELESAGTPVSIQLHSPVGLEPEVATAISQVVQRKLR